MNDPTGAAQTPHQYQAERSGWRTCAICGRGANAAIHKPETTTQEDQS